ncbi:galactose metabolism-related protein [Lecanora helva]
MGNQSSKPAGSHSPASPVTNHSSNSSTANSRKELRPQSSLKSHNANTSLQEKPSPSDLHSLPTNSSPSQRHRPIDEKMGNEHSRQQVHDHHVKDRDRDRDRHRHSKSTPVKVPRGSDPQRQRGPDSQFEPSGPPRDPNYIPHSNLNFPPRLPLPIEEEFHAPGSPVIAPQGFSPSLNEDDIDGHIPRQTSAISNTTIEDDAAGDELQPYPFEPPGGTVPTLLRWKQGGDKVYVTGTFAGWSRKFRMSKDHTTGHLSATLQLPPGTHHVKFIVDGEMQLSDELPTAVDYTNILVNYVEVSADDIPKGQVEEQKVPEGVYPPQVLHPGTDAKDHAPDAVGKTQIVEGEPQVEPVFWGKEGPRYLRDVDLPEQSQRYQRAAKAVNEFATPPGLPLFLGKSILNGTTPMKDDNSVLNMPNHTVLNHLATSSIKNDVLATSITTRYKRKYVTTIVYKPTELPD